MSNTADSTFLSLGLDIGTTTTHLVISQLTVGPGEDAFGRHHLLEKEIVYRSGIHLTPLDGDGCIDADRIAELVHAEYARANVKREDVLTGAVIVTGETAMKANAEQVVQRLAGESSSFAAAVAGANQEAILAGRGSGAAEHSRRHHCCTLNVDIGGGTTNLAWYQNGQPAAAGAIRVGGRHLLTLGDSSGNFAAASATAERFLRGKRTNADGARTWLAACVQNCEYAIAGAFDRVPAEFIVTRPAAIPPRAEVVFFSGGVAELMATISRGQSPANGFGDTGPMLASALLSSPAIGRWPIEYPAEPIRATVIGAGQFSMDFSGETLWADPALLPLRNLPVLRLPRCFQELSDAVAVAAAISRERHLRSIEPDQPVAVVLPSLRQADWDAVVRLAGQLAEAAEELNLPAPWVFAMQDNFGRLLGRTIAEASPHRPVIVIDEIDTREADFIDIGRPVERFRTVIPVVAKSLVFER